VSDASESITARNQSKSGVEIGSERLSMDQTERGEHERNKLRGAIAELTLRVSEKAVPPDRHLAGAA
jgi:hypothetical protein